MIDFVKNGLKEIKSTKKYATEKNVPNWTYQVIFASVMMLFIFATLIMFGITYLKPEKFIITEPLKTIINLSPIILTFLFMFKYGKLPIKLSILKQFYMQKGMIALINKLDMYFWRKYDKDSVASNFVSKHAKIIKFAPFIALAIYIIFF